MLIWKYRQLQYSQAPMVNIFDYELFQCRRNTCFHCLSFNFFHTFLSGIIIYKTLISPMMYFYKNE